MEDEVLTLDPSESVSEDVSDAPEVEASETPTEEVPTPEAPPEPPKISFDDDQQKFIDEVIVSKQVAKRKEAERQVQELESKLAELKPVEDNARPELPPEPDPFDDDYESKMGDYREAVAAQAKWDVEDSIRQEYEQRQQEEAIRQQAAALQGELQAYDQRAEEMGISSEDLQTFGMRLDQQGLNMNDNPALVHHIIRMENGPAVTAHLANNPQAVFELQQMSPMEQGAYLANIKTRSRKKAPSAPPPVDVPDGKAPPSSDPLLKGAVFE